MRSRTPNTKIRRREERLFANRLYADQIGPLASMIGRLRLATAPDHFQEIQSELLGRFLGCQEFIDGAKVEKAGVRDEIKSARKTRSGVEEIRNLSREVERLDEDIVAGHATLSLYRVIGDAFVWKLFDYQRHPVTVLGDGTRVGRLAAGEGLSAELEEMDRLWRVHGIFAVHADLTNCLRHGDLLSVERWERPRRFRITEVKARRALAASSPQAKRNQKVSELINQGFHPQGADGKPLVLRASPVRYRTHLPTLPAALRAARSSTYSWFSPEDGLLIEVFDGTNPAALSPAQREALVAETFEELGWDHEANALDLLGDSMSSRRARDRTSSFSSLAPVSLLPLELGDLVELLMGRFDVVTTLHLGRLEERFHDGGIEAVVARGSAAGETFLRAEREGAVTNVPATVREQILIELMTLETLVDSIDWVLADAERDGRDRPAVAVAFDEEAKTWTAFPGPGGTSAE